MSEKGIMVVGDVHGRWDYLNSLIAKHRPEMVLACGDFGFWPRIHEITIAEAVKNGDTEIRWCDGNHEDFWSLKERTSDEIAPKVFYQPRGSTITLPDGRVVLFMGGADSIDKECRTVGVSWFPEEVISQADFMNLPDANTRIDIVVSHTCPLEFRRNVERPIYGIPDTKSKDPSCYALSRILQTYRPSLWYFGHWHIYATGKSNGCYWTALDMADGDDAWWTWMKG